MDDIETISIVALWFIASVLIGLAAASFAIGLAVACLSAVFIFLLVKILREIQ